MVTTKKNFKMNSSSINYNEYTNFGFDISTFLSREALTISIFVFILFVITIRFYCFCDDYRKNSYSENLQSAFDELQRLKRKYYN